MKEPNDILFQVKTFLYERLLIAVVSATGQIFAFESPLLDGVIKSSY